MRPKSSMTPATMISVTSAMLDEPADDETYKLHDVSHRNLCDVGPDRMSEPAMRPTSSLMMATVISVPLAITNGPADDATCDLRAVGHNEWANL